MKWNLLLLFAAFFALSANADWRTPLPRPAASTQHARRASRAAQVMHGPLLARYLWGQGTDGNPGPSAHAFPGSTNKEASDKDVINQAGMPIGQGALDSQVLERNGKEVTNGRSVVAGLQFDPRNLEGTDRDVSYSTHPGGPGNLEGTDRDVNSHSAGMHRRRSERLARFLWQQGVSPTPRRATAHSPHPHGQDSVAGQDATRGRTEVARYLWQNASDNTEGRASPRVARYLWEQRRESQAGRQGIRMARYLWDDGTTPVGQDKQVKLARYLWQGKSDGLDYNTNLRNDNLHDTVAMFLWRSDRALRNAANIMPAGYIGNLAPRYRQPAQGLDPLWGTADTYEPIASIGKPVLAPVRKRFILVGRNVKKLKAQLNAMGAKVVADLSFIHSIAASLTRKQVEQLRHDPNVISITADRTVSTAAATSSSGGVTAADVPNADEVQTGEHRQTYFTKLIGADKLQREGVTGRGVTVAIIDTGLWHIRPLTTNTRGRNRILAYYDAIQNRTSVPMVDPNGHGSHIASIIASSRPSYNKNNERTGSWQGVAPDANLVIVRAFDHTGRSTYMDVIRGIAYVIAHKKEYNIRVLNLSFSGKPMSHYWQDPMNLAVMAAWRAGIVVVVSAGNSGPDAQTVGVPADVPYVITVGAMTDNYTSTDTSDDYLTPFSSRGPTMEGFLKPEIIAPGGHLMGLVSPNTYLAKEHPSFKDGDNYFLMSGTSQAAAVTSGVAALMLQVHPNLTPDTVKCRLMASAKEARRPDGALGYSVFEQGAGLINAVNAVASDASDCVNQGLNIAKDMAGTEHYGGPARENANGDYYLATAKGYSWDSAEPDIKGGDTWTLGNLWSANNIWNVGYVWNMSALAANGYIWDLADFENNGYNWDMAALEEKGYIWDMSATQTSQSTNTASATNPTGTGNALAGTNREGHGWQAREFHRNHGSIWDMGNVKGAGFVWNMAFNKNNGYIWNMGYIWDMNSASSNGYIWDMGTSKNTGYIWDMGSLANSGYIWDMSALANSGYIWDMNNVKNAGYIWDMNNVKNAGYIWDMNNVKNAGYIWDMNNLKNAGYIWDMNSPTNNGYIWDMNSTASAGYIWDMNSLKNAGYIWDMNSANNSGYIWNMAFDQNTGYIWDMNNVTNSGYIWDMGTSQTAGYIWDMSAITTSQSVAQE